MRLTICALSAVLLSGCSWMGTGGSNYSSNDGGFGGYGCQPAQYGGMQYGNAGYGGQTGYGGQYGGAGYNGGGGCSTGGYGTTGYGMGANGAGASAYGMGASGYGMGSSSMGSTGMGATGYGMSANGAGAGASGYGMGASGYGAGAGATGYGMGASGYGMGANGYGVGTGGLGLYGGQAAGANGLIGSSAFGQNGAGGTMLGAGAPYGMAGGGQYGPGGVRTIQGSPIYVPQPYPAYNYGYGGGYDGGLRGGGGGILPFGVEFGIGRAFALGGNITGAKPAGLALGSLTRTVTAADAFSYGDVYKNGLSYDAAATYDMSPSTTLLGRIGYASAEGKRVKLGQTTQAAVTEDYFGTYSDLKEITVEGGVRKYVGASNIRPYVGATAGLTHTNAVTLQHKSATIVTADPAIKFAPAAWKPTASGVVGAEMQVGGRTAIGVETGIRWNDNFKSVAGSSDRWTVPVKIRGRVSF